MAKSMQELTVPLSVVHSSPKTLNSSAYEPDREHSIKPGFNLTLFAIIRPKLTNRNYVKCQGRGIIFKNVNQQIFYELAGNKFS